MSISLLTQNNSAYLYLYPHAKEVNILNCPSVFISLWIKSKHIQGVFDQEWEISSISLIHTLRKVFFLAYYNISILMADNKQITQSFIVKFYRPVIGCDEAELWPGSSWWCKRHRLWSCPSWRWTRPPLSVASFASSSSKTLWGCLWCR